MSQILFRSVSSCIEPPFQSAAFLATFELLNVLAPRLISHGGLFAIHASLPVVRKNVQQQTDEEQALNQKESEAATTSENKENDTTLAKKKPITSSSANPNISSASTAQKSRLAYRPYTDFGFANFIFQSAETSEFATSLHFRLVRGADPKCMEKHIKACVDQARYARKVYFQQGSLNGIDISYCFANAKMLEEVYFMVTPSSENIAELALVAPNLQILYCSRADLITNEAIIKFCAGRKTLFENSKSSNPTSLHKLLLWECPLLNKLEAMEAIASLPALEILSIRRCPALAGADVERINKSISALATIPRLRDLDLEADITDVALRAIGEGLPLLRKLYFYNCPRMKHCSVDQGYFHLFKGLHQIEEFSATEIPPEALEELARCKTLKILKLYDCDAKDKDLEPLALLKNLEVLQLAHCDSLVLNEGIITSSGENVGENENDEDVNQQQQEKKSGFSRVSSGNLKRLVLNYCRGIDSGVYKVISNSFPNLKEINIFTAEAPLRDEDLQELSKLSHLEDVLIDNVRVAEVTLSKDALKFFGKSRLPNLRNLSLNGGLPKNLTEEKVWRIIDQN